MGESFWMLFVNFPAENLMKQNLVKYKTKAKIKKIVVPIA